MHDYKKLYLTLLHAMSEAITAMEHMDFGNAKELLTTAQHKTRKNNGSKRSNVYNRTETILSLFPMTR